MPKASSGALFADERGRGRRWVTEELLVQCSMCHPCRLASEAKGTSGLTATG